MIVVKPKFNSVFSIIAFLIIVFSAFAYTAYQYFIADSSSIYIYFGMIFSGGLGVGLLLKFLWNWKVIRIGKEKFNVNQPFRLRQSILNGKDLNHWDETTINTWGGKYSEITINFEGGKKITLSRQEHTDYDKALQYLHKKFKRLKKIK